MSYTAASVVVTLAVLAGPGGLRADVVGGQTRGEISAALTYPGTLLIVTTDDGVAAFTFGDPADRGTGYRFRLLPKGGGKEQTGTGKVFERYKAVRRGNPNEVEYEYDGGDLWLAAGPVQIKWSHGGPDSGWLYYNPEHVVVRERKATEFQAIDLKQFAK